MGLLTCEKSPRLTHYYCSQEGQKSSQGTVLKASCDRENYGRLFQCVILLQIHHTLSNVSYLFQDFSLS